MVSEPLKVKYNSIQHHLIPSFDGGINLEDVVSRSTCRLLQWDAL